MKYNKRIIYFLVLIIIIGLFSLSCGSKSGNSDNASSDGSNGIESESMDIMSINISKDKSNPSLYSFNDILMIQVIFNKTLSLEQKKSVAITFSPNYWKAPVGDTLWNDEYGKSFVTISYNYYSGNYALGDFTGAMTITVSGTGLKTMNFYISR